MPSNNTRAHVSIVLDGVQAERILKALAEEAKNAKAELAKMEEQLAQGLISEAEVKKQRTYVRSITSEYNKNTKQLSDLDDVMQNLANKTGRELEAALRSINKLWKDQDPATEKGRKKLAELAEQESKITARSKQLKAGIVDVGKVLAHLDKAPLEQLRRAEQQLVSETEVLTRGTGEYNRKMQELAKVRQTINDINSAFKKQESSLKQVAQRLAAYVGVYGAFNFIRGQVTQLMQKNLQFSDTLSDIRKTTLMTEEAVALLSDRLKELDTRTSNMDIAKLAYEAGKLGITGVANVTEFVKAADQVNIALGEQLNGLESITELMKINQVLGTTSQYGIQQSMLKTGSAINYLSQTSTAVGGRIVDFTARLAGIAASSNLSTDSVLGLAAASDALKQQVEVSATAFNKLIAQMFAKTKTVAEAVGIEFDALKEKLEMGQTSEALLMVLEGVRAKGGLSETGAIMKDLGSDGARLLQVLNAMANNVDFVRDSMNRSNKAFREGVSVTNEYNIKNENAAALWERLKNNIEKLFLSASNTGWLKDIIVDLQDLPKWIDRMAVGLWPIKVLFEGIVWSLGNITSAWAGFIAAFSVQKILVGLTNMSIGFTGLSTKIKEANGALAKTKVLLNSNWFTAIIGLIASIGYAWYNHNQQVKEAEQAYNKALASALSVAEVENQRLENLRNEAAPVYAALKLAEQELAQSIKIYGKNSKDAAEAQKDLEKAELDRQTTIANFNSNYSTYLGYLLKEKATEEELGRAIDAVNSKLRMKAILNAKADREQQIRQDTSGDISNAYVSTRDALVSFKGFDKAAAAEAIKYMREHPEEFLQNMGNGRYQAYGTDDNNATRVAALAKVLGLTEMDYQEGMKILSKFQVLINKSNEQKQKIADSNESFESELQVDATVHDKEVAPQVAAMWKDIEAFVNVDDKQQIALMRAQSGKVRDERKKQVQKWLEAARLDAEDLQHLTDADSKKRLTALQAQMARADAYLEKQVLGNTTDPNGNGKDAANREALRGARDEYQAIISKIEAYYQMQRQVVNDNFEKDKIDAVDREQQLRDIEQRLLQSRILARKRIVGKASEEEWQQEQEQMMLFNRASIEGIQQLAAIAEVDIDKISELLSTLGGTAEFDAIFRKAEEDETKQQDLRIKRLEQLRKLLIENNPLGKVTAEYEKTLREFDLISDRFKDRGEEDLRAYYQRIMGIVRTIGAQAGNVNLNSEAGIQQARDIMIGSGLSDTQANTMKPEEIRAFFHQAYKYAEDYSESARKLAKQTLDEWDKQYAAANGDKWFQDKIQGYERMAELAGRLEKYGLSESVALEAEVDKQAAVIAQEEYRIRLRRQKAEQDLQDAQNMQDDPKHPTRKSDAIAAAQAEMEQVQTEEEQLLTMYDDLAQAAMNLEEFNNRWIESLTKGFDKFAESFVSFRSFYDDKGDIWHNIFGTVEEREKAAGEFIDTIKKTMRQAIMEKVRARLSGQMQDKIDQAWQRMFQRKKELEQQVHEGNLTNIAATGGAVRQGIQQATDANLEAEQKAHNAKDEVEEGTHTAKKTSLSMAQAVAKCFADLGPIAGAVAVGVVTAVIGSFLTMALNAIGHDTHGQTNVNATKTKLVSGMLTYDDGNAQSVLATVPSGSPLGVVSDTGRTYRAIADPDATGLLTRPTVRPIGGAPALVAENGPELVVGRETTRALMMDYPNIVRTIVALEQHRRHTQAHRAYGIRAFDDGNAADLPSPDDASQSGMSEDTAQALTIAIATLCDQLQHPIQATIQRDGPGGAVDAVARGMLDSLKLGDLSSVQHLMKNRR